ncbi:elicitor-associated permease-like protein [Clostridium sp. BL-8]|uniref:elicitor-associated permease-like protein n=1 Tax=Clostridium sp. BL-8 TaxID=349938 RepID=UPI00098CEEA4|nr:elicitor-associated permease-like protein [Clostridium sp. BL-8]OOM69018.1 hypothetical protein CLOBL_52850 [Clostridium sp. BL-8]
MNFLNFLKYKYKLNSDVVKKRSSSVVYAERSAKFIFGILLCLLINFVLKLVPKDILNKMNAYTIVIYTLLCIFSMSIAIKKYYKEYFESAEREIILITPINQKQIILVRFFIVWIEVFSLIAFMYFPFVFACFINKIFSLEILLITVPEVLFISLLGSVFAHILFAVAFLVCKGKGLKTVSYYVLVVFSVLLTSLSFLYKNGFPNIAIKNIIIESIFYGLLQYPSYILFNEIHILDTLIFTIIIAFHSLVLFVIAINLTSYCYKKGLLMVSSRDLKKSFYISFQTKCINKFIQNNFLKKDIFYLIRTPQVLSSFISPIVVICLTLSQKSFYSSKMIFPVFIGIYSLIITSISISIIQSDDIQHKDLLISIPINYKGLITSRSLLTFIISFIISSPLISIMYIINQVKFTYTIFSLLQLMITIFITSKLMVKKVINLSIKETGSYRYDGKLALTVITFSFTWGIFLLILFCILFTILNL